MWLDQITDWVERSAGGGSLRASFIRATERATRRFPDAWFELGERSPEAVEGLADRAFTVCDRVAKGRFPFNGRTPFLSFYEDKPNETEIARHTFYARLSVLREVLRDDYCRNVRRDPELRRRDALYRELGKLLPQVARCDGTRWALAGGGPRRVRSTEQVAAMLRAEPEAPLADLLVRALDLLGQPARQSDLAHLLAEVTPPIPGMPTHEPSPQDAGARAVRDAVLAAWNELDEDARGLLAALIRDDDYDTISRRFPGLSTRPQVSRAMRRIADVFVARVAAAAELPDPGKADATPRTLLEHVVDVLLPLLPDPGDDHVRA